MAEFFDNIYTLIHQHQTVTVRMCCRFPQAASCPKGRGSHVEASLSRCASWPEVRSFVLTWL